MSGYIDKATLLSANDLREEDLELPTLGEGVRVRIRGLPAAYSNQAQSEALELVTGPRGDQSARVNSEKLEAIQVLHGLIEPKLATLEEVRTFALNTGPAFKAIVEKIDQLSGVNKEAIEKANATFPAGGPQATGDSLGDEPANGSGRSDLPVSTGA